MFSHQCVLDSFGIFAGGGVGDACRSFRGCHHVWPLWVQLLVGCNRCGWILFSSQRMETCIPDNIINCFDRSCNDCHGIVFRSCGSSGPYISIYLGNLDNGVSVAFNSCCDSCSHCSIVLRRRSPGTVLCHRMQANTDAHQKKGQGDDIIATMHVNVYVCSEAVCKVGEQLQMPMFTATYGKTTKICMSE